MLEKILTAKTVVLLKEITTDEGDTVEPGEYMIWGLLSFGWGNRCEAILDITSVRVRECGKGPHRTLGHLTLSPERFVEFFQPAKEV